MESNKVTTRVIAAVAKVSSMTVSLALRNHPRISVATRRKIQQLAAALGYRPDPKVAQLMHHLRRRHKPRYQSTICALTNSALGTGSQVYQQTIIRSAHRQAEALGYGFRLVDLAIDSRPNKALGRSLHYQGVEGVLIPPSVATADFSDFMDWEWFSVVAATYGVLAPDFHRVVPHQFGNSLLLCRELTQLGYRRIGLVLRRAQDVRVHHGFSAAVTWQSAFGGTESVTPLIHEGDAPADLARWFRREQPDVIIAGGPDDCRLIAKRLRVRLAGPIGFAATACFMNLRFSGIDEEPALIGRIAVDQLHAKILSHEKGVPAHPTTMMIKGRWNQGGTVRAQKRCPA